MRVGGTRTDGAVYLLFGGGLACILKGDRISPAVDYTEVERLGPWVDPTDNSFDVRRRLQAKADLAKVTPLARFVLDWDEGAHPRDATGRFGGGGGGSSKADDLSKNPAPYHPAPGEGYARGPEADARTAQIMETARQESRALDREDAQRIERMHGDTLDKADVSHARDRAQAAADDDPNELAMQDAREATGHTILEKTLSGHDRPVYDGLKSQQQRGVQRAVSDHATTHGTPHSVGITFNPQGHGRAHVEVTSTKSGKQRYVVGSGGAVTKL